MSKIVLFALVVDVAALDDLGEEGPHRAALAIEKTGLVSGFPPETSVKDSVGKRHTVAGRGEYRKEFTEPR